MRRLHDGGFPGSANCYSSGDISEPGLMMNVHFVIFFMVAVMLCVVRWLAGKDDDVYT